MNIVFVGIAGVFKQNRALDSRLRYFAQLLVLDNKVTVYSRYNSSMVSSNQPNIPARINYREIIRSRDTNHFLSKVLMFASIAIEPLFVFRSHRKEKIDIIHIYSEHFYNLLFYRFFSRIISAKIVCQYVEYSSDFKHKNLLNRINCKLYDHFIAKLCDGVIPISNFLDIKLKEINPRINTLKVNPLCDFAYFNTVEPKKLKNSYLLYCGSITYIDAIELIADSYENSIISKTKDLVFVLSGNEEKIKYFEEKHPQYSVLSYLEYDELISYYKGAFGLLIPLQNKVTDIARFPNKVGEYLAAKGLIITTNIGEMAYIFKDEINAVVVSDFDREQFTSKLDELESGRYDIGSIINNAYQLGLQMFDINSYRTQLNMFFRSLT